jgi:hypothetical protein
MQDETTAKDMVEKVQDLLGDEKTEPTVRLGAAKLAARMAQQVSGPLLPYMRTDHFLQARN